MPIEARGLYSPGGATLLLTPFSEQIGRLVRFPQAKYFSTLGENTGFYHKLPNSEEQKSSCILRAYVVDFPVAR